MKGLYIHVPFCRSICTYCDFVKEVAKPEKQGRYIAALLEEFTMVSEDLRGVTTVYIGGGTPSALSEQLITQLLGAVFTYVPRESVVECTFECNPEDVTRSLANRLKDAGVNRVSLGVETFNPRHLAFLNRHHDEDTIHKALRHLRDAGIDNISVDMIFSLVGQTMEELEQDIARVLSLEVDHISWYSLILEPDTRLHHLVNTGAVTMNDEDLEADMYETLIDRLIKAGYTHYEISNFCKNTRTSKHNLIYWRNDDYVGVGAGSHGKIGWQRTINVRSVKQYIELIDAGVRPLERVMPHEGLKDAMLMGMRLLEGVHVPTINKTFNSDLFKQYPELKPLINEGLLIYDHDHLRFTRRGLLLGNTVFAIF